MKRGEIWLADLGKGIGSEESGTRPVLIIQNDKGNTYGPCKIVAPLTSKIWRTHMPTHVFIERESLSNPSLIMMEQIRTISDERFINMLDTIDEKTMSLVDKAIKVSLGLEV